MNDPSSSTRPADGPEEIRVVFRRLGIEVFWRNGEVEFYGADEKAELTLAALSDAPSSLALFMVGVRDAERRGLLREPGRLREALDALEAILAFTFELPAAWGPVGPIEAMEAEAQEFRKAVRCLPEAAKVIGLHSSKQRLRKALSDDWVPLPK